MRRRLCQLSYARIWWQRLDLNRCSHITKTSGRTVITIDFHAPCSYHFVMNRVYPSKICAHCGIPFALTKPWHSQRKFCTFACSAANRKRNWRDYQKSKTCEFCLQPFLLVAANCSPKRFCNSTCSAKHNNSKRGPIPQSQKEAISKGLRSSTKNRTRKKFRHTCIICNIKFDHPRFKKLTCSEACMMVVKQRSGPKLGRIMARRLLKRSKDEIALYRLCADTWMNTTHNEVIVDGWDADILLNDQKVAVLWNGPWHYRQLQLVNHSLSQVQTRDRLKTRKFAELGWRVFVFEDRYFTPSSAYNSLVADLGSAPSLSPYESNILPERDR